MVCELFTVCGYCRHGEFPRGSQEPLIYAAQCFDRRAQAMRAGNCHVTRTLARTQVVPLNHHTVTYFYWASIYFNCRQTKYTDGNIEITVTEVIATQIVASRLGCYDNYENMHPMYVCS